MNRNREDALKTPEKGLENIARLFTENHRYIQLDTVDDLPIFLGYAGRGNQPRRLCMELKQIEDPAQISYIIEHRPYFETGLGQPSQWDDDGKEGNGRGIFAVYFDQRPIPEEGEQAWAVRLYPLFLGIAQHIAESGG